MTGARVRFVGERLRDGLKYLAERGVDEASANVEFMMAEVLDCGRAAVKASGDRRLSERQSSHFWGMVKHRGRRVPLAYVLGHQPFAGCDIKVTPAVLIPRPETEQLVEAVARIARETGARHIVDIGTGSGCVPIALAKALDGVMLYATEIDPGALAIAQENASRNGVSSRIRFLREDLFKPAQRSSPWADIVVSNPPYIPAGEIDKLDKEVLREPRLALDGGRDGLDAIRAIVADAPRVLKPGGSLCMEFGTGQEEKIVRLLAHGGFPGAATYPDISGKLRIVVARFPALK